MPKRLPIVGVDISSQWFDASNRSIKLDDNFENNKEGFKRFVKRLKKAGIKKARICMEATGLYFEELSEFLHAKGHEVVVVNPQCIKAYASSELSRSKSDPLDARLIEMYGEEKYSKLRLWQPLPEPHKTIREIMRRRQALVDERTAEKNRAAAGFSSPQVRSSISRCIEFLDEQIAELESEAFRLMKEDPELSELVELVTSIPGVGDLTAVSVLVEVPRVLWNGRLAAVFAGVIPSRKSSGKARVQSRLSKIGSSRLRGMLYMPAVCAIRCNSLLKDFYQRLLNRGLKEKQALTAVMRKLLHLIFGVIQTGSRFDSRYEEKRRALAKAA